MSRKKKKNLAKAKWSDLDKNTRLRIAKRMIATYVNGVKLSAGCYNVVGSAKHRALRDSPKVEHGGEDDAMTSILRAQFLNLARNGVRNNEALNAILKQFELNVIGTNGGKAYFDFGEEYQEEANVMIDTFANWTRQCEFFDGLNLQDVLKIMLRTVLLGGDLVAVFDDEMVENSGRLIIYEPDCIGEMDEASFAKRYPGYVQRRGRIYTKGSRFAGVIVSSAERGVETFENPEDCYVFMRDPNQDVNDCPWIMLGNRWRINQGRGTPPIAAPLGSLIDVSMLQGFEVESAKKQSQTYAQLVQTNPTADVDLSEVDEDDDSSTVYDDQGDDDGQGDDDNLKASIDEIFAKKPITFDELSVAGALYDVMPANSRLEFYSPQHPNLNVTEFIRQVQCRGGWAMGVASVYACGHVDSSYAGYRGEQLMTWPVFESWQKFFERFLDWVLVRWWKYESLYGSLGNLRLPNNWHRCVKWCFPMMREVNAVDAQNAWNLGLKNGTIGYETILGPEWKRILKLRAEQRDYCESVKFPHPANETVSGQVIESNSNQRKEDDNEK